mgnify:CR=1 FL=1
MTLPVGLEVRDLQGDALTQDRKQRDFKSVIVATVIMLWVWCISDLAIRAANSSCLRE